VEIEQLYDKLDGEAEAREKAAITCEELKRKLQIVTSTRDDLQNQLHLCNE
jgi:septation ring formation regulator EzrA